MKLGKINFSDETYDIFEPIYPFEFAIILYSFVDWNKTENESFMALRPGEKRCAVSSANAKRVTKDEIIVSIDLYYNEIELYIHDDIPVKYIVNGDETFELINR